MKTLFENATPELTVPNFVGLFTSPIGAVGALSLGDQMPDDALLGYEDVEVGAWSHAGEVVEKDGRVAQMHYELMTLLDPDAPGDDGAYHSTELQALFDALSTAVEAKMAPTVKSGSKRKYAWGSGSELTLEVRASTQDPGKKLYLLVSVYGSETA